MLTAGATQLRTATIVVPRTGERTKKAFTLRRHSSASNGSLDYFLDPGRDNEAPHRNTSRLERLRNGVTGRLDSAYAFATSPTGIAILKCSLAYVLGSLATFVPFIAGLLGKNDGKHMVATVTVYFHPARSAGSMAQAIMLAFGAVVYAAFLSFTSMAVSHYFGEKHLLALGHTIVLIIFCGGGLGLVGWTKQKLGNALVNVACSLTSLAFITIFTKEGAVQAAKFSHDKIWQVLKMVIMGTIASSAVALAVRPISARKEFRDTFIKATDAMGEMLTIITRSFLSGSEDSLRDPQFIKAISQSKSTFNTLVKNLGEAKYEHYVLGTEGEYEVESRLVKCLEQLMQSIGGLRSAAETQFALLANADQPQGTAGLLSPPLAPMRSPSPDSISSQNHMDRRTNLLASIDEVAGHSTAGSGSGRGRSPAPSRKLPMGMDSDLTAVDMFSIFIAHLGPPMVRFIRSFVSLSILTALEITRIHPS